jgi:hypothetical protein
MTAAAPAPLMRYANVTWIGARPNDLLRGHEIAQQQAAESKSPEADTLTRLLDLLDEHGEDDYGLLDPTQYAFRSAFKLVRLAQRQMVERIAGSPSVDSLGGIRITWRRDDREIRLVCPGDRGQQVYLYQESEHHNSAIHEVTPSVLAQKLSWLISGGYIL